MPVLTIPVSFSPNTTALSADVNGNFNAIATLLNSTKLDSANVQAGGLTGDRLANNTITATQIAAGSVTSAAIATGAVVAAGIAAGAVTTPALGAASVTATNMAANSVTTSAIANQSVYVYQMNPRSPANPAGSGDIGFSGSSGAFSTPTTTLTYDITNLSVTITTYGRPVRVELVWDGVSSASSSYLLNGLFTFLRNGASVSYQTVGSQTVPVSSMSHLDFVAAGTYTYKAQAFGNGGTASCACARLIAYEI